MNDAEQLVASKRLHEDEWSILIEKVNNGFVILEHNDNGIEVKTVIEEDNCNDEAEQTAKLAEKLISHIVDAFALYGSKHDRYRIRWQVEEREKDA